MMPKRFMRSISCAPSAVTPVSASAVAELRFRTRGAREVVVAVVHERDVARAEIVIAIEQLEILAEHVAVLDADCNDELAARGDPREIVRAVGELDAFGVELAPPCGGSR